MIKKKLLGLSFILSLLFVFATFGICSTSYGYTVDNLIDYCQQLVDYPYTATRIQNLAQYVINCKPVLKSNFGNLDVANIVVFYFGNNTFFFRYNNTPFRIKQTSSALQDEMGAYLVMPTFQITTTASYNSGTQNVSSLPFSDCIGLVTSNNNFNFGILPTSAYFNNQYIETPQFEFTQFGDVKNVVINNYSNVNVIYYNPLKNIYWGRIENYNELETSKLTIGLALETPDTNDEVIFNSIQYELVDYGRYYLFTDSSKIYLNRLYKLLVDYDNNVFTYYYYIAPYGAGYTTGQTIAYFYNSGDSVYNVQNSTNTIINNINNGDEVDDIMNEYLSGDFEDIASDFGFTPLDNPFTTFLLHIMEETFDALTETGNVNLHANYKGLVFDLNSDDFKAPNGTLKTFVSITLVSFYIYGCYKIFHYFITLIETARVEKAIAVLGHDEFYDSDIM